MNKKYMITSHYTLEEVIDIFINACNKNDVKKAIELLETCDEIFTNLDNYFYYTIQYDRPHPDYPNCGNYYDVDRCKIIECLKNRDILKYIIKDKRFDFDKYINNNVVIFSNNFFIYACCDGDYDIVECIVTDPRFDSSLIVTKHDDALPLQIALYNKHYDIYDLLLLTAHKFNIINIEILKKVYDETINNTTEPYYANIIKLKEYIDNPDDTINKIIQNKLNKTNIK